MNFLQHSLVFALRGYQRVISPALMGIFGPLARCRFEPSCSEYAVQAVREHGAMKGAILAAWRVCRCNPWGGCGLDPVPSHKFQISNLKFQMRTSTGQLECSCHVSTEAGVEPRNKDVSKRAFREQFTNLEIEMHKVPGFEMRESAERG